MFGIWDSNTDGEIHKIGFLFGHMTWLSNGETFEYTMPNEETILLDMGEEQYTAKLSHGGNTLEWDDGDVWIRAKYNPKGIIKTGPNLKGRPKPKTMPNGRPRRRRRVHFNPEPEVKKFVSIEPWHLDYSDHEYEETSDEDYGSDYDYETSDEEEGPYAGMESDGEDTVQVAYSSDSELTKEPGFTRGGAAIPSPIPLANPYPSYSASSNGGAVMSPHSDISTGGLYTPSTEHPANLNYKDCHIFPTNSFSSIPNVDRSLIQIQEVSDSNHSLLSTHTSDGDFSRYDSRDSFLSEGSDSEVYANVFEHINHDILGKKSTFQYVNTQSDSSLLSVGIEPTLPAPARMQEDNSKANYSSLEALQKLQTPDNLDSNHQDEEEDSSEDSSTPDDVSPVWGRRHVGPQARDTSNAKPTTPRRFNSIILSTVAGPNDPAFKKFEPNFRLGMKLQRLPQSLNSKPQGSPREVKELRTQRILQRQATPYHSPVQGVSSPGAPALSLSENTNSNKEGWNAVKVSCPKHMHVEIKVQESKQALGRARTQIREISPLVAPSGPPARAATSDRLLMTAEKTMLQAAHMLKKKKKRKRFSLGIRKPVKVTPIEMVSPMVGGEDPAFVASNDSPVTGAISPRFNIATIPAPVEIINSPLKSVNSHDLEKRTMISYASVASVDDSDDDDSPEQSENDTEEDLKTSKYTALLIQTTSSYLDETSERNVYTEESDSFSVDEEGYEDDLIQGGAEFCPPPTTTNDKSRNSLCIPTTQRKHSAPKKTDAGGRSRKKKTRKRRSFTLGAKKENATSSLSSGADPSHG